MKKQKGGLFWTIILIAVFLAFKLGIVRAIFVLLGGIFSFALSIIFSFLGFAIIIFLLWHFIIRKKN